MYKSNVTVWMLFLSTLVLSGCLDPVAPTVELGENPTGVTPPPSTPPIPTPPPTSDLKTIPEIPFNYSRAAGAITTSGRLPATINAGEVLAFTGQSEPSDLAINCSGTEENPAYIVGGTLSGAGDVFRINGSWCIFEGTIFDNIQPRTTGDHHIFRNVEIRNHQGKNGLDIRGTNMVIVDSEIHHNQGNDRHGIFVGSGSDSVWILGNHVHHNGGDGFQACDGCSANPPRNVYIGNNVFNSDRENAIDFKFIENVIVEGNIIHSLVNAPADEEWCFDDGSGCGVFSSGSDGSAIVVGSDGGPTNVLITNNEIFDTVIAVRVERGTLVSIVDNNFHDLTRRCLQLDKEGWDTVFTGNTCNNANRGIYQNWRVNFSLLVEDNIFENITGPSIEYETQQVCQDSRLVNNEFTASGPIICNNATYTSQDEVNTFPGVSSGNRVN